MLVGRYLCGIFLCTWRIFGALGVRVCKAEIGRIGECGEGDGDGEVLMVLMVQGRGAGVV